MFLRYGKENSPLKSILRLSGESTALFILEKFQVLYTFELYFLKDENILVISFLFLVD